MTPVLPADSHVHSQWSWDTDRTSMDRSCRRARELGIPAIVFTDHLDSTAWEIEPGDLDGVEHLAAHLRGATLSPPPLDVEGYLDGLQACRERFVGLHVLSGIEYGEPHRSTEAVRSAVRAAGFDRVLGSLHSLQVGEAFHEPPGLLRIWPPPRVMRVYLEELARMIRMSQDFDVLAHIDYPLRYWPAAAEPLDLRDVEDEFRHALRLLAATGRALEINTRHLLDPVILEWWRHEGGKSITFGSDAHRPEDLAQRFDVAAAMAAAHGFRPGSEPHDPWTAAVS